MNQTKHYLRQIKDYDERIRSKYLELERLRTIAEGFECEIKERVQSSKAKDRFEKAMADVIDYENSYSEDIQAAIKLRAKIIDEIDRVDDVKLRRLLISRYVEFKTFEQIAVDMDMSFRHIIRLHGSALKSFAHVLECHI